jgi:FkbM family methyltransferase
VAVIVDVDGTAVHLIDTDDRNVIHEQRGGYERESLAAWARMVKPGRVAIDVGAYTGLYSIVAAKRGARVFAFEPMVANFWRLGVNIALNKVFVTTKHCAVSDCEGTATLSYNPRVPLTTGASLEAGISANEKSVKTLCTTLDALAFQNVAAIKIDVERHELHVLRGAMQMIERDRPAMLIETLDDDMRVQVLSLLPRYAVAAVLDTRNTLFVPK